MIKLVTVFDSIKAHDWLEKDQGLFPSGVDMLAKAHYNSYLAIGKASALLAVLTFYFGEILVSQAKSF